MEVALLDYDQIGLLSWFALKLALPDVLTAPFQAIVGIGSLCTSWVANYAAEAYLMPSNMKGAWDH